MDIIVIYFKLLSKDHDHQTWDNPDVWWCWRHRML